MTPYTAKVVYQNVNNVLAIGEDYTSDGEQYKVLEIDLKIRVNLQLGP